MSVRVPNAKHKCQDAHFLGYKRAFSCNFANRDLSCAREFCPEGSKFSELIHLISHTRYVHQAKVQLDQDGLDLWQAALRNAITLESTGRGIQGYIDLLPEAIHLVAENLDLLGAALSIVESYVILDAHRVLSVSPLALVLTGVQCSGFQMYARQLFEAFVAAMSMAMGANVKSIILVINLIAQAVPAVLWAEAMHASGLFAALAKAVIDDKVSLCRNIQTLPANKGLAHRSGAYRAHLCIRPYRTFGPCGIQPACGSCRASVEYARNAGLRRSFGSMVVQSKPNVSKIVVSTLINISCQFDHMAEPRHRKLAAMGIASWVSTGRPEVLGRLNTEVFNIWLDVFGELKEALADQSVEGTLSIYTSSYCDSQITYS